MSKRNPSSPDFSFLGAESVSESSPAQQADPEPKTESPAQGESETPDSPTQSIPVESNVGGQINFTAIDPGESDDSPETALAAFRDSAIASAAAPVSESPNLSEKVSAENTAPEAVAGPDSMPPDLTPAVSPAPARVSPAPARVSPARRAQKPSATAESARDAVETIAEGAPVLTRRPGTIAVPAWFPGYTAAITLVLLFLLFTGRIQLSANHPLESLPDVRPLAPNEFQPVQEDVRLPEGHDLGLGESRRFGDVLVTPVKVSRAPLEFQDFLSGKPEPKLTTTPALRLHLKFENLAADIAFPPFDAALMSHRFQPEASELSILANSFLSVPPDAQNEFPRRLLHYPQTMDSNFVLTGQNAGKVVAPGESLETWVATVPLPDGWSHSGPMRWRVQFRKGINRKSRFGVTTLIDVNFNSTDIQG